MYTGGIMNKESILYGIIGLLVGVVITGFTATSAVNNNNRNMMQMMGMHRDGDGRSMKINDHDMSMGDMADNLKGKTGDDFDKAFLREMILHHQGAIEMANLAKQNAKHEEVKKLADGIVSAQTSEIKQMRSWQQEWNYGSSITPSMHGMMH